MSRSAVVKARALEVARTAVGAALGPERVHRWAHRLAPGWQDFARDASAIGERHWRQTRDTVAALRRKYEKPVFGPSRIWDLVEQLALCIDPSDGDLYGASQLVHVRQVVAGMERDGVTDPDLFLAAIVHDLGKVLLLTAEAPENVVCMNAPIGPHERGIGLDHVIFQWNHDEFVHSRLGPHLPDHLAWLLRYHSILIEPTRPFMDARDLDYLERYLIPFRRWDQGTKSCCALPPATVLEPYRDLVERAFPGTLLV